MASESQIANYSHELYQALRELRTIAPLTSRDELTIDDAYQISLGMLALREADGEKVIGKKIGATSKAVQDMLGIDRPDFGFLTDRMLIDSASAYPIAGNLIAPRAEAEIAFIMGKDLMGPGLTDQNVLDAAESVCTCFEIVDSRIADWKIRIVDTIADNASCGVFVLGDEHRNPRELELSKLHCKVTKNGQPLSEGYGSAVQGSPLTAVAWLANTLGAYGVPLKAGEIVLSGSLVPLEPVSSGDVFRAQIEGLGGVEIRFA